MKYHRYLSSAVIALSLAAPISLASAKDPPSAEALFRKGVADMEAGKLDVACPELSESQLVEPRPGTQFALALCDAKSGKIATAAALFEDYLGAVSKMRPDLASRHASRAKVASEQMAEITPQIPELTLKVRGSARADLRVTRDGVEVAHSTLGTSLRLDPGEHVITAQVEKGPVSERRITLKRGEKVTLDLPVDAPGRDPPAATAPIAPASASATAAIAIGAPAGPTATGGRMTERRIGALAAAGAGAAGLVVGAITGGLVLSKKSEIERGCTNGVCTHEGKAAADSVQAPAVASTVGFVVAGAGLATALVLFLTERTPAKEKRAGAMIAPALRAGPDGAAVFVKGAF